MRSPLLVTFFLLAMVSVVRSQDCPGAQPSGVVTLSGDVLYHDEIRQWLELRVPKPVCGETSIQLVSLSGSTRAWRKLDSVRGCHVTATGTLDVPGTGYYSAGLYLNVIKLTPDAVCVRQPPFPDYSKAKPARWVKDYKVAMRLDYAHGGKIHFEVTSAGKELEPWQAYASYQFTGEYVLYGFCGKQFRVKSVFGNPEANPTYYDQEPASFDPESAAAKNVTNLTLGYTCVR